GDHFRLPAGRTLRRPAQGFCAIRTLPGYPRGARGGGERPGDPVRSVRRTAEELDGAVEGELEALRGLQLRFVALANRSRQGLGCPAPERCDEFTVLTHVQSFLRRARRRRGARRAP